MSENRFLHPTMANRMSIAATLINSPRRCHPFRTSQPLSIFLHHLQLLHTLPTSLAAYRCCTSRTLGFCSSYAHHGRQQRERRPSDSTNRARAGRHPLTVSCLFQGFMATLLTAYSHPMTTPEQTDELERQMTAVAIDSPPM